MVHCIIVGFCDWEEVKTLIQQLRELDTNLSRIHYADNSNNREVKKQIRAIDNAVYYGFDNVGYGPAINAVLSTFPLHEDDAYVVMNDDVLFNGNCIQLLVNAYRKLKSSHEKLGVVSPNFIASDGKQDSRRYFTFRSKRNSSIAELEFGPAACWLFDNDFLKNVGGFYPDFFMYGEDHELIFRASHLGYKHYLIQDAFVIHNFNYPPNDNTLKLLKEVNIMSAHYLNPLSRQWAPHAFALKGMIYSFSRGHFQRFYYLIKGYAKFLLKISTLKRAKSAHTKAIHYRYIS